jgi:hypothetical protein
MVEQTISRTVMLSSRHPSVKASMSMIVDFRAPEYNVEINISPSLIPIELDQPIWSNGISAGVFDAVHEANYILVATGIDVKIRSLEISVGIPNLVPLESRRTQAPWAAN